MKDKIKPFNLERALAGDPVVTRDGRKVLRIAHFPECNKESKVYALIEDEDFAAIFCENGKYYGCVEPEDDLFMAPKTKKLWIAVEKIPNKNLRDGQIFITYGTSSAREELYILKDHYTPNEKYHFVETEIEE